MHHLCCCKSGDDEVLKYLFSLSETSDVLVYNAMVKYANKKIIKWQRVEYHNILIIQCEKLTA